MKGLLTEVTEGSRLVKEVGDLTGGTTTTYLLLLGCLLERGHPSASLLP